MAKIFPLPIKEFNEDGFARIRGVFTKEEADSMRLEAYGCLDKIVGNETRLQMVNGHPSLLFWPRNISSVLAGYADDDRMKHIVRSFLGDDVLQLNNQVYFRESWDGDEFNWHQDICFRTPPEDFPNIEDGGYLQTVIAIDEIRSDNGAVEFIPGSHKLGVMDLVPRDNSERGLRKFDRRGWSGVKLEADPGDVMIWSLLVVHGSEQNRSLRNRATYMNGFAKASAVNPKRWFPTYMKGQDAAIR